MVELLEHDARQVQRLDLAILVADLAGPRVISVVFPIRRLQELQVSVSPLFVWGLCQEVGLPTGVEAIQHAVLILDQKLADFLAWLSDQRLRSG
jgi:hypothetical protein